MTYQFTAVDNIDSQSNWQEMNVIKSLDHRFQTPKMKFLKYLWTVDYNRAFFAKKTDRRLKYGRKNRSIRSRTNATVSLPLEIEALMVLQHMLSWKLLCTAPPRSTVALSRFPDRRLADIVLYRCAHMKGRQQCRPEKNRILKKKKRQQPEGTKNTSFEQIYFWLGVACERWLVAGSATVWSAPPLLRPVFLIAFQQVTRTCRPCQRICGHTALAHP